MCWHRPLANGKSQLKVAGKPLSLAPRVPAATSETNSNTNRLGRPMAVGCLILVANLARDTTAEVRKGIAAARSTLHPIRPEVAQSGVLVGFPGSSGMCRLCCGQE